MQGFYLAVSLSKDEGFFAVRKCNRFSGILGLLKIWYKPTEKGVSHYYYYYYYYYSCSKKTCHKGFYHFAFVDGGNLIKMY